MQKRSFVQERSPVGYNGAERSVKRMDVRTDIINKVVEALVGVEQDIVDRVERVLHIQLQNYEVQERCTEVVLGNNHHRPVLSSPAIH